MQHDPYDEAARLKNRVSVDAGLDIDRIRPVSVRFRRFRAASSKA